MSRVTYLSLTRYVKVFKMLRDFCLYTGHGTCGEIFVTSIIIIIIIINEYD